MKKLYLAYLALALGCLLFFVYKDEKCNLVKIIDKQLIEMQCSMKVLEVHEDWEKYGTCYLNLSQILNFDWDTVIQFRGPILGETMPKALGFNYQYSVQDRRIRLIFVNSKKVACEIEYDGSGRYSSSIHLEKSIQNDNLYTIIPKERSRVSVTYERTSKYCKDCRLYIVKQF